MILFRDEWQRYAAIPDLETKNRSFIHMARVLKALGVKNHLFHLALYNPYLREVDPHSPTISPEEILMVIEECRINFWYFVREVARAPGQSGAPARPLEANRGNLALFWCFFNHVMTTLIQIRQTGKSFNTDVLGAYLLEIRCTDTQINLLTKDETLRRANIQRLKDIMGVLPPYLDSRTKRDANNTELITVKERGNLYQGHLPQASEKLAGNVGRGLTSPIFFVDEGPFQPNIQEALPAALAAGGAAREIADEAGEPYGTILTTTAGKKDTKEGKYFFNLISGMAEWSEAFYDAKDREDLEKILRRSGRDGEYRVNITMNHQQLGKTDEWLATKLGESVSTGDKADRDYFNRWTSGTATNPLNIQTLEKIRASQREPQHAEICNPGGYVVRWHVPENQIEARMNSSKYIVVFDTSEASGGDDISMRVTDIHTGDMVAAGTYNDTNIITFSEWVATWLTRWETTTMLIERRSTGVAVIDMLLLILPGKNIDPFKRIFNRIVNEHDEMPDRYKEISAPMWRRDGDIYVRNKKAFGFATSSSGLTSRAELYGSTLHSAAKQVGHLVADKTTIDQVASLIIKNGRVDHPAGEHDDMVIGWILTHWFMTKAKNLQHYDIVPSNILKDLRQTQTADPVDLYKISVQMKLRERIEEVSQAFQRENDDFISRRYEQELRYLYSRLELQENEKITLDELIAKTKEDKLRKRIDRGLDSSGHRDTHERERKFIQRIGHGQQFQSALFGGWSR